MIFIDIKNNNNNKLNNYNIEIPKYIIYLFMLLILSIKVGLCYTEFR